MPKAPHALCFRPFIAADAEVLGAWLAGAGLGVPPGVANADWAERLLRDPGIRCWAACATGGAVLGFFRLDTGPDRQAEITLIVAPEWRRCGVGDEMLEEALRQARQMGIRKLYAVVREDNDGSLSFFGARGFAVNGSNTPGNIHLHRLIHRAERQPPLEI